MSYLYTINEYVEYSNFISFRKQYFHKKSKEFLEGSEKNLKHYDERVANFDPDCLERTFELYVKKAEELLSGKKYFPFAKFNIIAYRLKYIYSKNCTIV